MTQSPSTFHLQDINATIIETHWYRISEILNVSKFQAKKVTQNKADLACLMKKNLNFNVEVDSTLKWRVSDRNPSWRTITN